MAEMTKKIERDFISSPDIDLLELQWWNSHAEIIAKVWEMHRGVSWAFRKRYLRRARSFLRQRGKEVTKILELGCGSGWVGQSIADSKLGVVGTDASEAQISLARQNARKSGLEGVCEYVSAATFDWDRVTRQIDAVLIHSFLHHLNGKEIEELFDIFKGRFNPGTKFWIYEPAFYAHASRRDTEDSSFNRPLVARIITALIALLGAFYSRYRLIDQSTCDDFKALMRESDKKGWYLSPKEVPFDLDSFSNYLEKYFQIESKYWATIYGVGWMFETNLLNSSLLRTVIARSIAPLISFADYRLSCNSHFLEQNVIAPNYALHVWECVLK